MLLDVAIQRFKVEIIPNVRWKHLTPHQWLWSNAFFNHRVHGGRRRDGKVWCNYPITISVISTEAQRNGEIYIGKFLVLLDVTIRQFNKNKF